MSRSERVRSQLVESGDPIRKHSLNQKKIRDILWQGRKLEAPRKAVKSMERRQAESQQREGHEQAKIARIRERVEAVIKGYDGSDPAVFRAELGFLRRSEIFYERFERAG